MIDHSVPSPGSGRIQRAARVAALALAMVLPAAAARAQSLNAGSLSGTVTDATGRRVGEATVTVTDVRTGLRRVRITPRQGTFSFNLLFTGQYDVLVERFGYQPRLMRRVTVSAGALTQAPFVLESAAPDAMVDTTTFAGAPGSGAHLALDGGTVASDLGELGTPYRQASGLSGLLSVSDAMLGAEGLPGRLGALAVDGVTRGSARHPLMASAAMDGLAFPMLFLADVEPLPGFDAEWAGAGGGLVSATTVPGSHLFSVTGVVSAGPAAQYGSLRISGPIVTDTAHYAFGVAFARLSPSLPAAWGGGARSAAVAAIAQDSFQTDLSAYTATYKPSSLVASGFGRFDWQLAANHRINVRASAATATDDDQDFGASPVDLGSRLTARDLSVALGLVSTLGLRAGSEFTAGVDAGNRDLTGSGRVGTAFTDGFAAGAAGLQPGEFHRTTFRVAETMHYRAGSSALKGGLELSFTSHDHTFADGRAGIFTFGDTTGFAGRSGAFWQSVGTSPQATFKTITGGVFAQGLFNVNADLELRLGVRYDVQSLPTDAVPGNTAWLTVTGIDNRLATVSHGLASPRIGFTWTMGSARRWHLRGEAGTFLEQIDPGEIAEAITHSGAVAVRRGFGNLGAWPNVPDSTVAPVAGPSLTLLGPDFTPPRTGRVRLGLGGNMAGAILRIDGAYRHTDYLPVRRDINLTLDPTARDQFGRPLYGMLRQSGSLLGVTPGSNRRFSGFDAVSSLDPVGASDYWGLTIALERDVERGLALLASYTYSRTTDNWFGAREWSAEGQLVPFTDSTGASPWSQGTSDFDIPHRVVAGIEQRFGGGLAPKLAILYRWRSGYAFTPGFRDGVDANGDGSGRNDPAFVTDTLVGASAVIAGNACLRAQVGHFAGRNSCRERPVGTLDVRLSFALSHRGGGSELTIDGLNLATMGGDVVDRALYLVDPAAAPVTNPATGVTTVSLLPNPNFGRTLVKRNPGATFRVGIRVGF